MLYNWRRTTRKTQLRENMINHTELDLKFKTQDPLKQNAPILALLLLKSGPKCVSYSSD